MNFWLILYPQNTNLVRYLSLQKIMKFIKTLLFSCLSIYSVSAQKDADLQRKFDSIYFATAVNVAAEDINKAIRIADSLYRNSKPENITAK